MSPLFACLPVCMTLSAIGLIGAVMLVFGLGNAIPGDDQPADETVKAKYPPPPLWVFPVTLLILILVMLVLAWYWPE